MVESGPSFVHDFKSWHFRLLSKFYFPSALGLCTGCCLLPLLASALSLVTRARHKQHHRAESTMAEAEEGGGPHLITLRDGFGAWGDVPALLRSEIFKWLP